MDVFRQAVLNNILAAFNGVVFSNPFLRKAFGQYPYDIQTLTFTEKSFRKQLLKAINNRKEPFVAIIKDDDGDIQDILFVPITKEKGKLRLIESTDHYCAGI